MNLVDLEICGALIYLYCRQDALTDLTVDADPIPTASEVDDAMAHSGMLRAAVYVASTISDHHLLDVAFQKAPVSTLLVHPDVCNLL